MLYENKYASQATQSGQFSLINVIGKEFMNAVKFVTFYYVTVNSTENKQFH